MQKVPTVSDLRLFLISGLLSAVVYLSSHLIVIPTDSDLLNEFKNSYLRMYESKFLKPYLG